jgi:uncharacterized short protein YbdD (DUF466 family)
MRHAAKITLRFIRRFWRGPQKSTTGFRLSSCASWSRRMARRTWRGLREWCGDAAYESYLRSKGCQSGSCRTLTPAEFYVEQLNRRYSKPNRCC